MRRSRRTIRYSLMGLATCCLLLFVVGISLSSAQQTPQQGPQPTDNATDSDGNAGEEERDVNTGEQKEGLNLLKLLSQGGFFMVPLGALSILVVAISFERILALRRSRVLPGRLVNELGRLSMDEGGFDPREAYRLATNYPSPAASVLRSMLLKVGRPQVEVEHAVQESSQREADRMYANVRWLTLCAAISPLVGLLGTVWGMIDAFYETTQLVEGQDKAEQLADGIYTALITTLCGLVIAIPSAIFAHFLEGRITTMFHEIDEMIFNLLPQVERFEGRVRFSRNIEADSRNAAATPPEMRMASDGKTHVPDVPQAAPPQHEPSPSGHGSAGNQGKP